MWKWIKRELVIIVIPADGTCEIGWIWVVIIAIKALAAVLHFAVALLKLTT